MVSIVVKQQNERQSIMATTNLAPGQTKRAKFGGVRSERCHTHKGDTPTNKHVIVNLGALILQGKL